MKQEPLNTIKQDTNLEKTNKMSKLNKTSLKALNRLGDIYCPKNGEFPSYSELGCVQHVNTMVAYTPASDVKDLNLLLNILAYMPTFFLKWLVKIVTNSAKKYGSSPLLRQLDFGLKGIILGTYYSGKTGDNYQGKKPLDIIGFSINRIED